MNNLIHCDMCGYLMTKRWSETIQGGTVTYKARIFTREEFRKVIAAAIYDYEHAPAKCLYTTKDAADQLYGEYGEEIEVEG